MIGVEEETTDGIHSSQIYRAQKKTRTSFFQIATSPIGVVGEMKLAWSMIERRRIYHIEKLGEDRLCEASLCHFRPPSYWMSF